MGQSKQWAADKASSTIHTTLRFNSHLIALIPKEYAMMCICVTVQVSARLLFRLFQGRYWKILCQAGGKSIE
jgi:hypothetical protein